MQFRIRLVLAILIGVAFNSCGGWSDKDPPSDSAGGTGGISLVGGSDETGGELPPGAVPAIMGDDGQYHCTEGALLMKREPPMCTAQTSTLPNDASTPEPDLPPASVPDAALPNDASTPEPDAPAQEWEFQDGMQLYCNGSNRACTASRLRNGYISCEPSGIPESGYPEDLIRNICTPAE